MKTSTMSSPVCGAWVRLTKWACPRRAGLRCSTTRERPRRQSLCSRSSTLTTVAGAGRLATCGAGTSRTNSTGMTFRSNIPGSGNSSRTGGAARPSLQILSSWKLCPSRCVRLPRRCGSFTPSVGMSSTIAGMPTVGSGERTSLSSPTLSRRISTTSGLDSAVEGNSSTSACSG